jgi:starch phosphorylase
MLLEKQLETLSQKGYGKALKELSNEEVYAVLLHLVKDLTEEKPLIDGERKVYYFSAEFLIGKLMSNNLINLGIRKDVKDILEKNGFSLSEIEEIENEPSLGNGGLGRLAACFLDSIATLDLPGDGVGLNYHLGLFKQTFKDKKQYEMPNPWIDENTWLNKTGKSYLVEYKDFALRSRLYDIDVLGYKGNKNKLHLFDIDSVDEAIVKDGISFDKENVLKNLTLFLYPDDSDEEGKKLRLYQQYFMVSSGAQMILEDLRKKKIDLRDLAKHVAIQINDTHPSLIIPELIRLMMKEGITIKEAIRIVSKTCAYTNHTILAEALEKWPMHYLEEIVPQLIPIIEALDAVAGERSSNEKTAIIDKDQLVHMASMDIHFGYAINGVAAIHTDILKNTELKDFYDLYPSKFNNKTNGITFRRWLLSCNEELTDFIDSLIGEGYKEDASKLDELLKFINDDKVLNELLSIKDKKKADFVKYIKDKEDIDLNKDSIFDVQIKRLHEYKRQQMNVLSIIHQYLEIKKGHYPAHPITCIFGAKAAPAYILAKDIIHTILCLQSLINNDPEVNKYLRVVMVENYNVTYAEKIIPAADFSEQISLASKEASGTGNMKLMLNGAITIGTDDGANVEIHQLVGDENIYVFGKDSDTVIAHYENEDYSSAKILEEDEDIRELVDFIVSDEMKEISGKDGIESLERLHHDLWTKDWFMALLDVKDYIKTKQQAIEDYSNRRVWAQKMLINIAKAGYFSSDRTIAQYNEDIWKLK